MRIPHEDAGSNQFAPSDELRLAARLLALECLATRPNWSPNRSALRRVLVEVGAKSGTGEVPDGDEFKLLSRAAEQLGIRAAVTRLSLVQALECAQQGLRLATPLPDSTGDWLTVTGGAGNRLQVETVAAGRQEALLNELSGRLKVADTSVPLSWLIGEHPSASPPSVDGKDHSHSEHDEHHGPSPLRRLVSLLWPESRDVIVVALFSAVVGILSLATPLAVEALVNTISFGRLFQPLIVMCVILFGFLGFGAALKTLQSYVAELIQERLFVRIVADLAYRLPRVDRRAYDDKHAPELLNRFFDVMTVQKSAALLVLDGLAILLKTLIGMTVLAFYHPLLLAFDVFLLAMMALVIFVLGRGAVRTAIEESKAKYAVAAWLQELAQFVQSFKGEGGPRHALERADALATDYLTARRNHFRILMRQFIFAFGMQALSGSILLGIGGWLVMQGQISLGQLVAAELIVAVIVDTFAKLNKHAESFYDLLAAVDKIGHLLDLPFERLTGNVLPTHERGIALRVQGAGFTYDDGALALHDVNLHIGSGEMVAISSSSGLAASVFLDLLFGLRQANSGYVCADDVDLRSLNPSSYRGQVALVRHVELFTGTIAENVHLNRDHVDERRVRDVLRAVGLWEDILRLSDGLGTLLQPSGGPLTDCQARRLMLARAMANRPRLLLIDRLLDALSDEMLPGMIAALQNLQPSCTIVIVTGRDEIRGVCQPCPLDDPSGGRAWEENSVRTAPPAVGGL